MATNEKIQFALVIVTCLSIIIPLIVQFLKHLIYKPKVSIKTDISSNELFTECSLNTKTSNLDYISFKIRIVNKGKKTAENVQIVLHTIKVENNQTAILLKFPPMKLYWSYQDDRIKNNLIPLTMQKIQPKSFEDCDFLFLDKNHKIGFFAAMNSPYVIKNYENYRIKLIISGDNFDSFEKTIAFTFNPNDVNKFVQNISVK